MPANYLPPPRAAFTDASCILKIYKYHLFRRVSISRHWTRISLAIAFYLHARRAYLALREYMLHIENIIEASAMSATSLLLKLPRVGPGIAARIDYHLKAH